MTHKFLKCVFLFLIFSTITFDDSHAKRTRPPVSEIPISHYQNSNTSTSTHQWRSTQQAGAQRLFDTNLKPTLPFILAGILSFMAALISSSGGIGGGGLFIPILTIIAGLDLKTASSFSAFMVAGGSTANVACHMFAGGNRKRGGGVLINYDIALLSEPCMLLGVSCGVICNLVFPEWLTTIIFANFLAFSTFKTCKSGVLYWKLESEGVIRRNGGQNSGNGEDFGESTKVPLLSEDPNTGCKLKMIPWMKLGMLVIIWFSFLILYLLRGNRYGQGIIHIKACGKVYWIISSIQIPIAILFTAWILYGLEGPKDSTSRHQENGDEINQSSEKLLFPIMALLAGVLGGVFGIGGGMLISPLLLQMGMEPEVTAATCSFMVLFSSTMSAVQFLLLGMEDIYGALAYAVICFVASVIGLTLVQRAIMKHGRASVIVFSVGTVMTLSTVLMTSFGAVDIWRDYTSGKSMGFKRPC